MSYFLTVGILLGLSAGIAPGPLLTLVVSETLSGGVGAGVRVALSPLLSDLPIILFAVFLLASFRKFRYCWGRCLSSVGFLFFIWVMKACEPKK